MLPTFDQFLQQANPSTFLTEGRGRQLLATIIGRYPPVVAARQLEDASKLTKTKLSTAEILQKHMRGGRAAETACLAYYYWLHAEGIESAELEELDELAGLDSLGWFPRAPRLEEYLGPEQVHSDLHFTSAIVDAFGRQDEQAALRRFLVDDRPFCWLQLAGEAGQGKSRLAFDLVNQAKADGWTAGFLSDRGLSEFQTEWASWQPTQSTLIVIDYVLGRERDVAVAFQNLIRRASDFKAPVRLLLLERQPWNQGALARPPMPSEEFVPAPHGRAAWFLGICQNVPADSDEAVGTQFQGGVICLGGLRPDDLDSIVEQLLSRHGLEAAGSPHLQDILHRIDPSGRPLFAHLLALSLIEGDFREEWSREDLLTATLEREQAKRWARLLKESERTAPGLDEDGPSIRLARLATMIGGFDNMMATRDPALRGTAITDPQILREALVLVDGPVGSGAPLAGFIPAMEPDLLGEWFVLWAFANGSADNERLVQNAWLLAPNKVPGFLVRCAQSFPNRPEVHWLLDILPVDETARKAFETTSPSLVNTLIASGATALPPTLRALLETQSTDNLLAAHILAVCKMEGRFWDEDGEEALALFEKGVAAGYAPSLVSLAGVLIVREPDQSASSKRAFDLLLTAADAGEPTGMARLAHCYAYGIGVEPDPIEAFAWASRAASQGDPEGLLNLARCYGKGIGTSRDPRRQLDYYERAALGGNQIAMVMLGNCRLDGVGAPPNAAVGLRWIERAARVGSSEAMFTLAFRYLTGHGVQQNRAEGMRWLAAAAEAGEVEAMLQLAHQLEAGPHDSRNDQLAAYWLSRAAKLGNQQAMLFLALRHLVGAGVEASEQPFIQWYGQYALAEGSVGMMNLARQYWSQIGAQPSELFLHRFRQLVAAKAGDVR